MSTDREREALARLIDPSAFDGVNEGRASRFEALVVAERILAAGWMPRPEPGSPDSVITAFRIAAETIAADEDRLRKLRVFVDYWPTIDAYDPPPEVAEDVSEIVMAMVALADATRAALAAPDTGGADG